MVKAAWFLAGACALTALAGCIDPEQQLALDRQQCAGFGFTPGTDAFAGCMMRITQQRQAEAAAAERQRQVEAILAEKKQIMARIDTKLSDSVASFLLETLGHEVDLGAQQTYLTKMLEEHKDDFKRSLSE